VEQELVTPIQSQERLKTFTLKEIKDEIKMLNNKKAPSLEFITARMLKNYQRRTRKPNVQGGSNMTGTDLYVNKPHCAAAVRP